MIEKPIRKYLKQKDYQKHKILRRIKKRNQRRKEAASKIAERALRKKLKLPAFEGGKDEDELLIGGYVAPELVVTPEGNTFRTTESGLPAVSTGALLEAGIPIRRKSKELKNNQKLLGRDEYLAQQAAVDEKVNKTTPSVELLFNIATIGGWNNLSPTQWMRRAYDTGRLINGNMSLDEYMNKLYFGNSGIVSDEYAREHPHRVMAANLIGDMATFGISSALLKMPRESGGYIRKNIISPQDKPSTLSWEEVVKSPQITAENAASITPEQWTAAQDAAIVRGDMAEAQRLRDLHFKTSAPNTEITDIQYHGSPYTFNVFDPAKRGNTDQGWFGKGYYFTPSKDYAAMYGEARPFYINAEDVYTKGVGNTWFGRESSPQAKVWLKMQDKKGKGPEAETILDDLRFSDAVRDAMPQTKPYNGIFEEVVTRNNNQMKLADAITYDDNGVRIPLGERDNFSINDIRYGLIPISVGLTGYGLYNSVTDPIISSYNRGKDPIHIKPSKRGTFTAAAKKRGMGVLLFANKVLKNPSNYSSAMRKKALFAKNATKFKH